MGVEQARQEAIRVLTLVDLADVAEQNHQASATVW